MLNVVIVVFTLKNLVLSGNLVNKPNICKEYITEQTSKTHILHHKFT